MNISHVASKQENIYKARQIYQIMRPNIQGTSLCQR